MPRGPRLDYPGALHHLIVRGRERRRIFRTDDDRQQCLERRAALVRNTQAGLYAWALMPNHAQLLLRTGTLPLSRSMQRWFGPSASRFNRGYRRAGHLFQNRFKNTLVEEEPYLLELVRYIHLNPVRSALPVTLDAVDHYPWTGHAVLLGHRDYPAQDIDFVLHHVGASAGSARAAYREFVRAGADRVGQGELEGGGLRREVLVARAIVSHLAVHHYGLSLSAAGRQLSLSKQSITRAWERAARVFGEVGCGPADFLLDG